MNNHDENYQLSQEIYTALDEILVPNSGIAGMAVLHAKSSRHGPSNPESRYHTSTNPAHLSELGSSLKEGRKVEESWYKFLVPGL
jgi:hypothetical protein